MIQKHANLSTESVTPPCTDLSTLQSSREELTRFLYFVFLSFAIERRKYWKESKAHLNTEIDEQVSVLLSMLVEYYCSKLSDNDSSLVGSLVPVAAIVFLWESWMPCFSFVLLMNCNWKLCWNVQWGSWSSSSAHLCEQQAFGSAQSSQNIWRQDNMYLVLGLSGIRTMPSPKNTYWLPHISSSRCGNCRRPHLIEKTNQIDTNEGFKTQGRSTAFPNPLKYRLAYSHYDFWCMLLPKSAVLHGFRRWTPQQMGLSWKVECREKLYR